MQASKKHSFCAAVHWLVVVLAFVLVSTALVLIVGHTVLAPYRALLGAVLQHNESHNPEICWIMLPSSATYGG